MSVPRAAKVAGLSVLGVVTTLLVVLAMTRTVASPPAADAPLTAEQATSTALAGSTRVQDTSSAVPVVVSLFSDGHALQEGSWYYRVTLREDATDVERGVQLGGERATAQSMLDELDQVAPGDVVMVALGAAELDQGVPPPAIVDDIKLVVAGIRQRDGIPVLVTLPPADGRGFLTKLVNRRLRSVAERRNVPLVDVFTGLGTVPGKWLPQFSDDGQVANEAGALAQADAAAAVLDPLVSDLVDERQG